MKINTNLIYKSRYDDSFHREPFLFESQSDIDWLLYRLTYYRSPNELRISIGGIMIHVFKSFEIENRKDICELVSIEMEESK